MNSRLQLVLETRILADAMHVKFGVDAIAWAFNRCTRVGQCRRGGLSPGDPALGGPVLAEALAHTPALGGRAAPQVLPARDAAAGALLALLQRGPRPRPRARPVAPLLNSSPSTPYPHNRYSHTFMILTIASAHDERCTRKHCKHFSSTLTTV